MAKYSTNYVCDECGFSSTDKHLVQRHSCDVEQNGGFHEDYPACGCEYGDCNGRKYGSEESMKETYYRLASIYGDGAEFDDAWERIYGD
jgi:hypothetical protein